MQMQLKNIRRSDTCLNCGSALDPINDNYCPACGQLNNTKKETALGMVRELVGDFLHLDSKVSRSLLPLLFRPGYLTKEFNLGRRVRYFHPVRMFLILTVILFIVSGLQEKNGSRPVVRTVTDSPKQKVTESGETRQPGASEINIGDSSTTTPDFSGLNVNIDSLRSMIDAGNLDNEAMMDRLGIGKNIFSKIMFSQIVRVQKQGFEKLLDYYSNKLPWMLFALMPVFAFVLYLLYIRRKIYFVDHLIHAFHLHSAVFLIMSVAGLLQWLTGWNTNWMLMYIPAYYYISLHRVYEQNWPTSLAKGTLAGMLYLLLGILALLLVAAVMFLMF